MNMNMNKNEHRNKWLLTINIGVEIVNVGLLQLLVNALQISQRRDCEADLRQSTNQPIPINEARLCLTSKISLFPKLSGWRPSVRTIPAGPSQGSMCTE